MNATIKILAPILICTTILLTGFLPLVVVAGDLDAIESALLRGEWKEVTTLADALDSNDPLTRASVTRYQVIALRQTGREADALTFADKALKELSGAVKSGSKKKPAKLSPELEESRQWLQFEKARLLLTQSKKRQLGLTILEELSHATNSPVAPAVLYYLAAERARTDNIDGAALAFNLSRDAYPEAVGEEQLVDLLAGDESTSDDSQPGKKSAVSTDETANRATNTRYSIQLGVFSAKGNADAILVKVSSKRLPGSIEKKIVSGKNYFAALVGSFSNLTDAQRVRDSLEVAHNATFTVITR